MSEFIGLAYFAEIPVVLFDVQRGRAVDRHAHAHPAVPTCSPAPTPRTATPRHVLLFPADPEECFDMAVAAFDLAERLQTPVFVMSRSGHRHERLDVPELQWDDEYRPDRGKVLDAEELESLDKFGRYEDVDGDGIR